MRRSKYSVSLIASMLGEVMDELFGPGFKSVLLHHIEQKLGVNSVEDIIIAVLDKPRPLYDAIAEVLGGEAGADMLIATISRAIIRRLGLKATPRMAVEALKKGDKEAVTSMLDTIGIRLARGTSGERQKKRRAAGKGTHDNM